jgi:hypothetical protein
MAAWRPQKQKKGQITKIKKFLGVLPKGILTPSFIEIAPAVTKRALLSDEELNLGNSGPVLHVWFQQSEVPSKT